MLKHATIINEITPDELLELIEKKIDAAISKLKVDLIIAQPQEDNTEEFLTKKAAAAYLKISTVTLSKYI
ncbi:MAG TPA: hypothetical protein VK705_11480, partial [Ferruginibacter sp.]|nr:hypothetical protein [Ferruginibacter sp.]